MKARKEALRRACIEQRGALPFTSCFSGSDVIVSSLKENFSIEKGQKVFAYLAIGKEVNIDAYLAYLLEQGVEVYVPHCLSERGIMEAVQLHSLEDVKTGKYGIREPREINKTALPEELDYILVPGVAFDEKGGRLGMGAGYYDRFLPITAIERRIGIAWEMQIQHEDIPMEEQDVRMGYIVTEQRILAITHQS